MGERFARQPGCPNQTEQHGETPSAHPGYEAVLLPTRHTLQRRERLQKMTVHLMPPCLFASTSSLQAAKEDFVPLVCQGIVEDS
jgi:hypothetical protein